MRISSVMNPNVATCEAKESCLQAAQVMRDRNVGFVVITDLRRAKVAGVVTDRDICLAALTMGKLLSEIPLEGVMSKEVHSCRDASDLAFAHTAMRKHQVRRLPVLDASGALVGVVSLSDLARQAAEVGTPSEIALTLAQISVSHSSSAALRGGM